MQISAKEIARLLDGKIEGNAEAIVTRPAKIEEGGSKTISFLSNPKYEQYLYKVEHTIVLVSDTFVPNKAVKAEAIIRVKDVYQAVSKLLQTFDNQHNTTSEISSSAFIKESATIGKDVSVGAFSVIEEGAIISDQSVIFPNVYIGKSVKVGKNCLIYPGVKIYHDCEIGDGCILHSNVVIGGDGFGFAPQKDGSYMKIPQLGNVVIENDVEIGANATIDRATMGSTRIKQGCKIDNLVMIAHNVEIGEHTVIAAQAGFAGSGKIGKHCMIGGQAGFVGHITVADQTRVQAQSGVAGSVEKPKQALYGSPALPYRNYLKSYALFRQLPEIWKKIQDLVIKVEKLEKDQ